MPASHEDLTETDAECLCRELQRSPARRVPQRASVQKPQRATPANCDFGGPRPAVLPTTALERMAFGGFSLSVRYQHPPITDEAVGYFNGLTDNSALAHIRDRRLGT